MQEGANLWGAAIAAIITALFGGVALIIGEYRKKGKLTSGTPSEETAQSQAVFLAGAITDGKQIAALTKAIEAVKEIMSERADEQDRNADQAHRDARAMCDNMESLSRAVRENTDAQRRGPAQDTTGLEAMLRILDARKGQ